MRDEQAPGTDTEKLKAQADYARLADVEQHHRSSVRSTLAKGILFLLARVQELEAALNTEAEINRTQQRELEREGARVVELERAVASVVDDLQAHERAAAGLPRPLPDHLHPQRMIARLKVAVRHG